MGFGVLRVTLGILTALLLFSEGPDANQKARKMPQGGIENAPLWGEMLLMLPERPK